MPISVDDAYLNQAINVQTTIASGAPTSYVLVAENLDITGIVLKPGHTRFGLGGILTNALTTVRTDMKARLDEVGQTARQRATDLGHFMAMTGDTEDFNTMTAQQFLGSGQGWNLGSPGSSPPPATP